MREIMEMVSSLIKTYEKAVGADILLPKDTVSFGKCPVCGKPVIERAKSFPVPIGSANLHYGRMIISSMRLERA